MKLYTNNASYYLKIHQNKMDFPWTIIFHGFMGSSKAMEPLASRLKKTCNPVTIDLLGHGTSIVEADPKRFTSASQIQDLHSILNRLHLRNLFIYGYSMGGRLAQHLIHSAPSRFSGLILESTHCGIMNDTERNNRIKIDEVRAQKIESDFDSFLDYWSNLPLFQSSQDSDSTDYKSILRNQQPERMAATLRGFGAGVMPPVCNRLAKVKIPVGLIAGKEDQKYVDKMTEMAQLCTDSELRIINGAGHRVHADRPDKVAEFITQFLYKHG